MSGERGRSEQERHYRLVHRTLYRYPETVTSSYGLATLLPRDGHGQRVHAAGLTVTPTPAETAGHVDIHGNRSTWFHVTQEHTVLEVEAVSLLTVTRRRLDPTSVPQVPWEQAVAAVSSMRSTGHGGQGEGPSSVLTVVESALPSELVEPGEEALEYALPSFGRGTPLVRAVADLSHRIRTEFTYRPGATTVHTRLPELLERRTGVCQDFAHVMIAGLRSLGLAARYVSGYIETIPAPGKEKLRGVDASHAWVAAWIPGGGWVHIDPTNDQFIDNRYVLLGWGRDFRDVSPLRGIVYSSGGGARPEVGVDLWPLTAGELAEERSAGLAVPR
ncbi:transglutaminase family protein [Georgenia sp. M64]|uniref:transglutaminase family protein n=1 Tax=Georgenia sp. M64 TaxID=3120520 RepID=UPI0030E56F67